LFFDEAMGMTRRAWLVLIAALLVTALTARLGWWQLERAAYKRGLQSSWDTRSQLPFLQSSELVSALAPLAISQAPALPSTLAQAEVFHHRRIVLRGRWLAQHTVYLDNRQMQGRTGFGVLTPLQLEGQASAVWVQRGWVPRNVQDRMSLPLLPLPLDKVVNVQGRVAALPGRVYEFESAATSSGAIRQNLDVPSFALTTGLRFLPVSVLQTVPVQADDQGLQRDWPLPQANVYKHDGYAFQWFALSALVVGLYIWFQVIQPRRRLNRPQTNRLQTESVT
jgi:surfeit locus 1 family protein